ncbi:MAG: hypothetical protein V4654_07005 [Bdellovibrionota bacterium]
MNHTITKFFILSLLLAALAACSAKSLTEVPAPSAPTATDEPVFCSTATSYSPGVAVSGTAKFRRRGVDLGSSGGVVTSVTTGAVISPSLPIKYAEIKVLRAGTVIQCGTTNNLGELRALDGVSPLFVPNEAGTYTIEVYARANYTFPSIGKPTSATLSTAVKEDIYSNDVYKISGTYSSNGSGGGINTPLNLLAQAQESVSAKIEGGAFNIYNDWVTAFEYLISTSNTGSADVSCLNPRLDMFWKAGFNPATYIDPNAGSSTLSFYLRDDNELYICGGVTGNVTSADTDHWDDAVILHEMGHHIENVCGRMDSPGGAHYALYRIDPRLAWSEAWGNFIGGHIIKNNTAKINPNLVGALPNGEWLHYNDTKGYNDGAVNTGTSLIMMRLNKAGDGSGAGTAHDPVNAATSPGESHTREASIARGLFKGTNTCTNCGGGISFDKYWTALGRSSNGMGVSTSPFSSSAKFFAKVFTANSNTFTASMTSIMTDDEALHLVGSTSYTTTVSVSSTGTTSSTNAWPGYGIKLTTSTSCNQNVLQPRATTYTFARDSDQRYSNHFYTIRKADLSGVTAIRLIPDSSCTVDLDLIVFNSDYDYAEDCTAYNSTPNCTSFAKVSSNDMAVLSRGSTNTEQVSISGLSSSYFLLNVRGYTNSPTTIPSNSACVYRLADQTGRTLCPSTSY